MAMGAYTTALLTKALAPSAFFAATGLHIWLGVLAGTVVAAVFGALLAFPALARARTLSRHGHHRVRLGDLQDPAGMGGGHRRRSRPRLDPQGADRLLCVRDPGLLLRRAGAVRRRARAAIPAGQLGARPAHPRHEAQRARGRFGRHQHPSAQGAGLRHQRGLRRLRRHAVRSPAELHQSRQFPVLQLGLLPARRAVRRRRNPDGAGHRRRRAHAAARDAARLRQVPPDRLRRFHPGHALFPAQWRHGSACRRGARRKEVAGAARRGRDGRACPRAPVRRWSCATSACASAACRRCAT